MESMGRREVSPAPFVHAEFKAESSRCASAATVRRQVARDFDLTETAVREWSNRPNVTSDPRGRRPDQRRARRARSAAPGEPRLREESNPETGDSFLREGDPVNVYTFIEAEKVASRNVARACS